MDLRERKSVSQTEIAREIDVGQTAVSSYKTGEKTPSMDVAVKLADYAGMCVEHLLTGKGPQRPWGTMDAQFQTLVQFWENLDDAARMKLLEHAELLHNNQPKKRRPRWAPLDPDKPPRRPPH